MFKLVKMKPSEIFDAWNVFVKAAVEVSLPPTVAGVPNQAEFVLNALMQERMQGWVGLDEEGESKKPVGFLTTMFTGEPGVEGKNLLIYTLFAPATLNPEYVEESFRVIKQFARANNCHKILGYTNIPKVVEWVMHIGGKADYVLVSMEVNDE